MKTTQGLNEFWMNGLISGAAILMIAPPASAVAKVTSVQLEPTDAGVNLVLETTGSDRPQVFSVKRGNALTADIVNTQLQLPSKGFKKLNPAEGIAAIAVTPLTKNSVRVTVTGKAGAPNGTITRSQADELAFQLSPSTTNIADTPIGADDDTSKTKTLPSAPAKSKASKVLSRKVQTTQVILPLPNGIQSLPQVIAQATQKNTGKTPVVVTPVPATAGTTSAPLGTPRPVSAQAPADQNGLPPFQNATPLVPNPRVAVEGKPYTAPPAVPPFAPAPLPRAVAPPVGDIAVGQIDATPGFIDLGTAERVPRLVLRDASSREVLSLLARSAGLNIVFTADQQGNQRQQQQQQQQQQAVADGPKVTLDIVNEPIQNVFNYVLQITGLEASRRGNTIFVGPRLPNSARNVVVRSLRLNQVPVTTALPFLVTLGAESAVSRERLVTAVNAIPITNISQAGQGQVGQNQAVTQSQTTTEQRLEVQRVEYQDSTPILRGLQVSGDERTNTVTLVGEARKVEIAIAQLAQLDVRRRQVAVNVRVIDVDLLAFERIATSFSFGINDTQVANEGGIAVVNFGQRLPASTGLSAPLAPGSTFGPATDLSNTGRSALGFLKGFFLQLQAAVTNGSAKVLTDPTLVVQEGQEAQVELGEEVITNIRQNTTATDNSTQITVTVEKAVAGLTLPINIDRIDDNGFISLSVAPLISRPQQTQNISFTSQGQTVTNPITLLALRRVQSGQVRLRDGQTLLLSGIIQDQDRTTVTKVPILGDIPILGALFRRTETQNQRREVIVLLTPRILDDTDRSAFGYSYTPGAETQRVLNNINR